jgi:hypothetical protein
MDEPNFLIRRTDDTRDMSVYELTIAYLNAQLKEKNAEIERLREAIKLIRISTCEEFAKNVCDNALNGTFRVEE